METVSLPSFQNKTSLGGFLIILSPAHVSRGHVNTKTSAVNPPPGLVSLEQLRLYVFHLFSYQSVFPQAVFPPRLAWLRSKPVNNFLLSLPVSQPLLVFYTPQELVWVRTGWRGSVKYIATSSEAVEALQTLPVWRLKLDFYKFGVSDKNLNRLISG